MSLRDKLPPEEVAAARQRYTVTRATHIIREMRQQQHSAEMIARALDASGLLASPGHDAEVAARAWDEGHTAGVRNSSAEFDGPVQDNPYKREGGAS